MCRFAPEMHRNRWRPGLKPGPRWGSLRRSPIPSSRAALGAFGLLHLGASALLDVLRTDRLEPPMAIGPPNIFDVVPPVML
jgi:hypothetical protein